MIEFIKEIALEAGEISIAEFSSLRDENIDFKNDKDIVTAADRKVEEFLMGELTLCADLVKAELKRDLLIGPGAIIHGDGNHVCGLEIHEAQRIP